MTLVPNDDSKYIKNIKNCGAKSITNNSDDYDEKHMKIKFNSNNDLPLDKTLKLHNMTIAIGSVFHEGNKYYPQDFLKERLLNYKCLNMIGLMCLKELMLTKLIVYTSLLFVITDIFLT